MGNICFKGYREKKKSKKNSDHSKDQNNNAEESKQLVDRILKDDFKNQSFLKDNMNVYSEDPNPDSDGERPDIMEASYTNSVEMGDEAISPTLVDSNSAFTSREFAPRPKLKYLRQPRSISGQSTIGVKSQHFNSLSMKRSLAKNHDTESDLELYRNSFLDDIQSSLVNTPGETFCQISLSDHRSITHSLIGMKKAARQLKRLLLQKDELADMSPQTPRRQLSNFGCSLNSPSVLSIKTSVFADEMARLDDLTTEDLRDKVEQLSQISLNLIRELEAKDERIQELEKKISHLHNTHKRQ